MSLLEASQPPSSKTPRFVVFGAVIVLLIAFFVWRAVRYDAEEKIASTFFSTLAAGDMQQAYQLWQAMPSYSFKDFQDDWGSGGYYGPVKSFKIDSASAPKDSTSVAVTVSISPYQPFPKRDPAKQSKTRKVIIWVDSKTHSLSFPPPPMSLRLAPPEPRRALAELASRFPA